MKIKCLVESLGAKDVLQKYISKIENQNSVNELTKEDLLAKYFSQIGTEDTRKLYKIYKDDFTAFGYEFQFRNLDIYI